MDRSMHTWMDGRMGRSMSTWTEGWMCREMTWNLHFPLELLLSAPFGSSVGKPDLRESRIV